MGHLLERAVIGAIVVATLLVSPALSATASGASTPVKVDPWTFVGTASQCGGTGGTASAVSADWVNHEGEPDGESQALYLQKFASTANCSAAGATVDGAAGASLGELGFDARDDGHCGAGAPRFDVVTTDDVTHFFGCSYGTHTSLGDGWTQVRFRPADGLPTVTSTEAVRSVDIVFDEGTDVGPGFVYLDNIDFNGTIVRNRGAGK